MIQVYFCQIATGRVYCLAEEEEITCDLGCSTVADRLQSVCICHVCSLERWSYHQNKEFKCHCYWSTGVHTCGYIQCVAAHRRVAWDHPRNALRWAVQADAFPGGTRELSAAPPLHYYRSTPLSACLFLSCVTLLSYSRQSTSTIEVLKKLSSKKSLFFLKKNVCCK